MMSLATIRHMSDEQARKASAVRKVPYVPFDVEEVERWGTGGKPFPFPNLGSYRPHGWILEDELFCDASGFGGENEPALSPRKLREKVKEIIGGDESKTYGFAITDVGQFQLYVGVFERTAEADNPPPPSRSDLIDALRYAVEEDHPCEDTQGCDIAVALENGYYLWAAHLLMGATECPATDEAWEALVATDKSDGQTQREADAECDEMVKIPHVECESCGSVNWGCDGEMPSGSCANCLKRLPEPDGEEEEDGDEEDEKECA